MLDLKGPSDSFYEILVKVRSDFNDCECESLTIQLGKLDHWDYIKLHKSLAVQIMLIQDLYTAGVNDLL